MLLVLACVLLIATTLVAYASRVLFDSGRFSARATVALKSATVREAIAERLTGELVRRHPDLLAVRPAVVAAVSGVVGGDAFSSLFRRGVRDVHGAVFRRERGHGHADDRGRRDRGRRGPARARAGAGVRAGAARAGHAARARPRQRDGRSRAAGEQRAGARVCAGAARGGSGRRCGGVGGEPAAGGIATGSRDRGRGCGDRDRRGGARRGRPRSLRRPGRASRGGGRVGRVPGRPSHDRLADRRIGRRAGSGRRVADPADRSRGAVARRVAHRHQRAEAGGAAPRAWRGADRGRRAGDRATLVRC